MIMRFVTSPHEPIRHDYLRRSPFCDNRRHSQRVAFFKRDHDDTRGINSVTLSWQTLLGTMDTLLVITAYHHRYDHTLTVGVPVVLSHQHRISRQ